MSTFRTQSSFERSFVAINEDSTGEVISFVPYMLPSATSSVVSWRYQYLKRALDLLLAIGMIAFFAIPGVIIAAAILLTSRGPVIYREERIGRNGVPFRICKFRSMYKDAALRSHVECAQSGGKLLEWRMSKHLRHLRDPRITAVGGVLRRLSLDELPQLFNILRGEMSFIGPRPIIEAETILYGKLLKFYLAVTPGLSGLWQVSERSNVDYAKRAALDASYVCSWTLRSDLSIFLRTVPAVLGGRGAR